MAGTFKRLRRYRTSSSHRELFQDLRLTPHDIIIPIFVHDKPKSEPVESMPFVKRHSLESALKFIEKQVKKGFFTFIVFPAIDSKLKEATCKVAIDTDGLAARAIKIFKQSYPNCIFCADVALDPYHPHGQDGLTDDDGYVNNDKTLQILGQQSLVLAHAGADVVAPSDMMDGRVQYIRKALEQRGLIHTLIASYSIKFCSNLYGPFRDAVQSRNNLGSGDKKTYQMAFDSQFQVDLELEADLNEGCDILIIKPATMYLDLIYRTHMKTPTPIWAYHVSGECAMLYSAAQNNLVDLTPTLYEQLIAIKRAGASKIITYLSEQAEDFLLK